MILNVQTRKVTRAKRKIILQPLEFSLLEYLMRNSGRVVSKTMIMEHVSDQSRTREGVGLGLSLAKAFAESMNGIIQVNSVINQGSTFTLKFRQ